MISSSKDKGSFRDPSGFIFSRDGILYRQINNSFKNDYTYLMNSGLYQDLVNNNLIIPHEEVEIEPHSAESSYKVIKPEKLAFITYPYEWCFSQYKRAALATLEIQKTALSYDMTLKDASTYNIQFQDNNPLLIDTLSFEGYEQGRPWDGYHQFCKHFLAPLLLMSYCDVRLNSLMRVFIDGLPLDIASSLLPKKTKYNLSIAAHIHIHAKAQKRYTGEEINRKAISQRVRKEGVISLIDSLGHLIKKLTWGSEETSWGDYLSFHNYSDSAYKLKKALVQEFIEHANPGVVWDFGANTGEFSRLSSKKGITTVAFDIDHGAVEQGYLQSIKEGDNHIHHSIIDLFNPSPCLGWNNSERKSLIKRGPTDLLMALALVHHLAIGNNLPFELIGDFFSSLTNWLIIEFVPKEDSQVKKLLSSRRDIFENYTQAQFEGAFSNYFSIVKKEPVKDTTRTLYLMKKLEV